MTLQEINGAAEVIYESVDPDANIIFGALVDESITDGHVSVTVLATGFEEAAKPVVERVRPEVRSVTGGRSSTASSSSYFDR
jgi:cell division protein FtsZ